MLSFKEWLVEEAKKPKKKKEDKDVKSTSQGSTEVGNVYHQRPTPRSNQEVQQRPETQANMQVLAFFTSVLIQSVLNC